MNPKSGSHHPKRLETLCGLLKQKNIHFQKVITQHSLHATQIAQEALSKGYRNFIISGGDGTYNEVINGVFGQQAVLPNEITLAMIPSGTGNDWIKTMKVPFEIEKIVDLIIEKKSFLQDIGKVTFFEENQQKESYFLNVAGTGFDVYVAKNFLSNGKKMGKLSYALGVMKGLFSYENTSINIRLQDGQEIKTKIFLLAVGICKYFASGVKICPEAIPDDGHFDLTLFKGMTKWETFRELRKIKQIVEGRFENVSQIEIFRSDTFSITSDQKIYLQSDGELMGHSPFEFSILPKSINVIAAPNLSFS